MKTKYTTHVSQSAFVLGAGVAAIVFAVLTFKIVAASYSERLNSTTMNSMEASASRSSSMPTSAQREQVEAEVITILPTGFQPAQITRPSGSFLLAVENRSGIKQIDFQLNAESGSRILQVTRTWERADWSEVVNPPPGRYVLTEANHPAWRCVITISR